MGTLSDDQPTEEAELRRRLGEIYDELAEVPSTEIGRRASLQHERDAIAERLRSLAANPTISHAWTDRAGLRPSGDVTPVIVSPGEGGG
ncbi:hypothetical protein BDK89_3782 [Ilumatobacter fluminis]|uniref:Uncharacterized protein n=1 Tax=Ilumatobacter fluminis TaxID=467091 RepID=A0A4R7I3X2_9ACTN|nr:hypothetical protein [Ilumatobacter fluminis]TDT18165.1 hypothetical protein BDK89_3782 [Ilumatobacter fluminis]